MRIILLEMKKIWNFRLLAAIVLICALFYTIFMKFDIDHYPNGHPWTESVALSTFMIQKYGATLEEDEFADLKKVREGFIAEAEQYIREKPVFARTGIFSYADYEKTYNGERTAEEDEAIWTLLGEECGFLEFKIEVINNVIEHYTIRAEQIGSQMEEHAQNSARYGRYTEILDTNEYANIMDEHTFDNTKEYITMLTVLSLLSTFILVSPLVVTDRSRKTNLLQYSARQGRRILTKQLAGIAFSSVIMTTILLGVFGLIYSGLGTQVYWNQGLTSFYSLVIMQVPITFGQYIILMVLLMYFLSVGAAFICFILSRFSQNTVTLVIKLLPAFGVMISLCIFVMTGLLKIGRLWIEPAMCFLVFLLGMAAAIFALRRERRVDVV